MAVLAADVILPFKGHPQKFSFSANGADEFYEGALLYVDTGGGCQVLPAAGDMFLGIVASHQTVTASGQEVEAFIGGTVLFPPCVNVTAADEGDVLIMDISAAQSDNPADCLSATDATAAANDILIGRIVRVIAAVSTANPRLGVWVTLHQAQGLYVAALGWGG